MQAIKPSESLKAVVSGKNKSFSFQKISFLRFITHLSHDSSGSLATWALEHGRDYFFLSQISPVISPYNLKCRVES